MVGLFKMASTGNGGFNKKSEAFSKNTRILLKLFSDKWRLFEDIFNRIEVFQRIRGFFKLFSDKWSLFLVM
jgi:hypothetical protein